MVSELHETGWEEVLVDSGAVHSMFGEFYMSSVFPFVSRRWRLSSIKVPLWGYCCVSPTSLPH